MEDSSLTPPHPIGVLKTTQAFSSHHITIHCISCQSTLALPDEIVQIASTFLLVKPDTIGVISTDNQRELKCFHCHQFVGYKGNTSSDLGKNEMVNSCYRIMKKDSKKNKTEPSPLICWTGDQSLHTRLESVKETGGSMVKIKKAIECVDLSTLTESELAQFELMRREEFDRYYLIKLDKDNGDLRNEEFFTKLSEYKDKMALSKWQWFSKMLDKEFKNHPKLYKKMCEVVVSHVIKEIQGQEEYKILNTASQSLISQRVKSKLLVPEFRLENVPESLAAPKEEFLLSEANVDQYIIYIDLVKANFNALKLFSPELVLNCETWSQLIEKQTDSILLQNSGSIRHKVFGKLNHHLCKKKNQINNIQQEVLKALYYGLTHAHDTVIDEEHHETIFMCTCDELYIRTTRDRLEVVFSFVKNYLEKSNFHNIVHLGSFLLHKYDYDTTMHDGFFYVKQFVHREKGREDTDFEIKGVMRETRHTAHLHFDSCIAKLLKNPN